MDRNSSSRGVGPVPPWERVKCDYVSHVGRCDICAGRIGKNPLHIVFSDDGCPSRQLCVKCGKSYLDSYRAAYEAMNRHE